MIDRFVGMSTNRQSPLPPSESESLTACSKVFQTLSSTPRATTQYQFMPDQGSAGAIRRNTSTTSNCLSDFEKERQDTKLESAETRERERPIHFVYTCAPWLNDINSRSKFRGDHGVKSSIETQPQAQVGQPSRLHIGRCLLLRAATVEQRRRGDRRRRHEAGLLKSGEC